MELEQAETAAQEIVEDIQNRKGLGDAWESIENELQDEIKAKWRDIILGETM